MEVKKVQLFLRILAILVLVLTACLVSLDTQTKLVFNILEKKATFKDLDALFVSSCWAPSSPTGSEIHHCKSA
ncbi:hypothetical protein QQ045_027057 [Rhodiola kirilowii]